MRFYQLEAKQRVQKSEEVVSIEAVPSWFGTEREAVVKRNEMFKAGKLSGLKRESLITPVDVPTDKAGLLKFLKDNVPALVIV